MKLKKSILSILLILLTLAGCKGAKTEFPIPKATVVEEFNSLEKHERSDNSYKKSKREETYKAKLLFAGDILPHGNFNDYALNVGDGEYDYEYNFEKLKDFTTNSDLFIANNEFTVNPNLETSGYPTFNSNEAIYRAIKDMGVDVLTTANNHSLDTGIEGLESTIDAIHKYGMDNVGTQKDNDKHYLIKKVNHINVGILSYAEDLNGLDYILEDYEYKSMVNKLDPYLIKEDIQNIIDKGADYVVVYPHWGVEYSSYPTEDQITLARDMIEWGADAVIGNHPHVIQPKEIYTAKDGREGIIYYSLGNLVSNQTYETLEDYRVEHGLIVEVDIEKTNKKKRAKAVYEKPFTTRNEIIVDDYGYLNRAYVVDEYINGGTKSDEVSDYTLEMMQLAEDMNEETLNTEIE